MDEIRKDASPPPVQKAWKWDRSDTFGKIAEAFAKAQGEFPVIPKDSEVEVWNKERTKILYKYKYADLTTILACCRPSMSKYGISITQGVVPGGFATLFIHAGSGEYLQTGFIPCKIPDSMDMKAVAGIVTYVKRISLTAALGVSADEDVDAAGIEAQQGNSTDKKNLGKKSDPRAQQKFSGPTQKMLARLYAIGKSVEWSPDAIRVYSLAKVNKTPGQLSKAQYDALCKHLEGSPYDEMQAEEINGMYQNLTEDQLALLEGEKS